MRVHLCCQSLYGPPSAVPPSSSSAPGLLYISLPSLCLACLHYSTFTARPQMPRSMPSTELGLGKYLSKERREEKGWWEEEEREEEENTSWLTLGYNHPHCLPRGLLLKPLGLSKPSPTCLGSLCVSQVAKCFLPGAL